MRSPVISVIIPTFNRSEILEKCLLALHHQSIERDRYEVIVVDDGSTDQTEKVVHATRSVFSGIRYLKKDNRGPAAARNLGIRNSKGEILLFIGDDVIASPDLVREHVRWHKENYPRDHIAILGFVTWSPEIKVTPFMKWLEHGGPQFGYYRFVHGQDVPPGDLYTANVSYKKSFLLRHSLFDEDFSYAAFEDSELGLRLSKKGLIGIFNKKAFAYHHHPMTFSSYCRRMENVGAASLLLYEKLGMTGVHAFGHASKFRGWVKALGYPLYRQILTLIDAHFSICIPRHYLKVLEYHRIKGIERANALHNLH